MKINFNIKMRFLRIKDPITYNLKKIEDKNKLLQQTLNTPFIYNVL
jgi:hypothetical protein